MSWHDFAWTSGHLGWGLFALIAFTIGWWLLADLVWRTRPSSRRTFAASIGAGWLVGVIIVLAVWRGTGH